MKRVFIKRLFRFSSIILVSIFMLFFLSCGDDDDDGVRAIVTYALPKDEERANASKIYRKSQVDSITFFDDGKFIWTSGDSVGDSTPATSEILTTIDIHEVETAFYGRYNNGTLFLSDRAGADSRLKLFINDLTALRVTWTASTAEGSLTIIDGDTLLVPQNLTTSNSDWKEVTISATTSDTIDGKTITIEPFVLYVTGPYGPQHQGFNISIMGFYQGTPWKGEVKLLGEWRLDSSDPTAVTTFSNPAVINGCCLTLDKPKGLSSDGVAKSVNLYKNGIKAYVLTFKIADEDEISEYPNKIITTIETRDNRVVQTPSTPLVAAGKIFLGWIYDNKTIAAGDKFLFDKGADTSLTAKWVTDAPLSVAFNGGESQTVTSLWTFGSAGSYKFSGTIDSKNFGAIMKKTLDAEGGITLDFSSCVGNEIRLPFGTVNNNLCGGTTSTPNETLKEIKLPPNLFTLVPYAFYNCKALTSVTLGNDTTKVYDTAYLKCDSLPNTPGL